MVAALHSQQQQQQPPSVKCSNKDNDDNKSTSSTLVGENESGSNNNHNTSSNMNNDEDLDDGSSLQRQGHNNNEVRHGFDQEAYEEDIIRFLYFTEKRHDTNAKPNATVRTALKDWRLRERIKTVSGLLVVCLNIGTDPPDIVKTNPCAKLECWIDPFLLIPQKSLEAIGKSLHNQYETINGRTRFKLSLDPSVEETKKVCCQMRRNAKEERILFHYNGHGVPKPTTSGEIWVFNRNYTQYIPVSLFDLQSWLGSPVLYVWDCSAAGNIIHAFNRFAEQRDLEAQRLSQQQQQQQHSNNSQHHHSSNNLSAQTPHTSPQAYLPQWKDSIQLAACGPNETLPMNPDLPADVFTACLTTPIEMSLRWVVMRNPLLTTNITMDMVLQLPGRATERRTPLGELNWIFTAVTDTIAWCVLQDQPELFKRLFRQDLTVASMFRNFLLAERIMRSYQCTPMSTPKLPETHDHPMWQAWDLAVDMCLFQLPALKAAEAGGPPYEYQSSTFFSEQLTAFEVWLSEGAVNPKIPEQLPIVLQVLLSQVHRLRALILLSRFLDLGPWAVNAALSVGIFPYVLKLLQSPAAELKPVLVFIWARILAVDRSCQNDLLKDHGYAYFINILTPSHAMLSIPHVSEHRAMSAFILSVFCTNFKMGQQACLRSNIISACLAHVADPDPLLRQWVCLCLAQVWMNNNSEAKSAAIAENGHEKLCLLLTDHVPEVRAAAMYALGTFLADGKSTSSANATAGATASAAVAATQNAKTEQIMNIEHNIAIAALTVMNDGSPMVRKELVVTLSHIVDQAGADKFLAAASQTIEEDQYLYQRNSTMENGSGWRSTTSLAEAAAAAIASSTISNNTFGTTSYDSVYAVVWKALLSLSVDPHPDVCQSASALVDHINLMLLSMSLTREYGSNLRDSLLSSPGQSPQHRHAQEYLERSSLDDSPSARKRPGMNANTNKLVRSVSFASTLRNIYNFGTSSSLDLSPSSQQQHHEAMPPIASLSSLRLQQTPSNTHHLHHHTTSVLEENANVLPLSSTFYDWSCEYFTEPQMRAAEADEPGSVVYTQRKWRRSRNEKILQEANTTKGFAATKKTRWDEQINTMYNDTEATLLLLHQFEPHLVAADAYNSLVVWDWKTGTPLSVIDNHNPAHSRITDLKFINEEDEALLLTGSDDGVIRLYKNYDGSDPENEEAIVVSSWRALKNLERSNTRHSGLITDWHQARGLLFTGGDARIIKSWDVHQEMPVMDIPTHSSSCVSSLTSDQLSGNILIAGFGDGSIGVYDRRLNPNEARVKLWNEHKAWITGIHLQREGTRELVSGGFEGDIKIWDIRETKSIRTIEAHTHNEMIALAVHDHSSVIASAGDDQVIKVWKMDGTKLSTIRPSSGSGGFLSQKLSPFTRSLAFHPNLMVMAASGNDGYITLYKPH
ncbi:raptor N-terminal caspase like domain-containing protein [Mycotypha africana]|uniref:raptor N-terminal caspase like domain-containing protein n=1 Tax=Mycotypha africana TaxID=64632 RepID=UPI0022FFE7A2|nr:raptor N-terminal caspase like domain-containing protein [Mycotypha africana]KAI8984718.1 raptor N-terminal caspase like domain-containing protein [Mycotypha africana]